MSIISCNLNKHRSIIMKKLITTITAAALALGMGTALAGPSTDVNTSATTQASRKAPSYLFVMHANKGEISKNKNAGYSLTMNLPDVDQVIAFSDRPYRIVKYITGNALAKLWTKGKNSFATDPPNAVLTAKDMKPQIVQLNSITVNGDKVIYGLQLTAPTNKLAHNLENITVTIDRAFERMVTPGEWPDVGEQRD